MGEKGVPGKRGAARGRGAMPDSDLVIWVAACVSVGIIVLATAVSYGLCFVRSPLGKLAMGLFALSQALVILFVTWSSWRLGTGRSYALFVSACGAVCGIIDPAVFRGLAIAEERAAKQALEGELEEQLVVQERHLERALGSACEAERLRDSLADLFAEMGEAVKRRDARRAQELLGQASVLVPPKGEVICPNPAIDALLDSKVEQCRSQQTLVEVRADVPSHLPLPVVEVCAVLSNLIDNAMAAVRPLPVEERRIEVSVLDRGGGLAILVRNRLNGETARRALSDSRRGGDVLSDAEGELPEHGWGLSIVELIAERHEGTFSTSVRDGWFEARVLLVR